MPYKDMKDRNYKHEYAAYGGTPEQKKLRAERNRARYAMMKKGLVHKGDGKDVDHKTPLSKGGKPGVGNLRVQTSHENRAYNRNPDHSVKLRTTNKKK